MITTKRYKVITEEDGLKVTYQYVDTYVFGVRVRRDIEEIARRGLHISQDLRETIQWLDLDQCVYCGWCEELAENPKQLRPLTIDHIFPQVQGGDSQVFNLVWACRNCNSAKNGRTPIEAGMTLRYGRYNPRVTSVPIDRETYEAHASPFWELWSDYVAGYGYCAEFNAAFVACGGRLPFHDRSGNAARAKAMINPPELEVAMLTIPRKVKA